MSPANSLFLGIDGGGSSCRAVLCHSSGRTLGSGKAGPANIATGYDHAVENILKCVRLAFDSAGEDHSLQAEVPVVLGLAGVNSVDNPNRLKNDLPFRQAEITTDALISLEGAIGGVDGCVAMIGTGSVYAYRRDGVARTAGGWGFTVSDLSSGSQLGRALLEEALLAYDGIRDGSPLTERILADFKNNPQSIAAYARDALPGDFAKRAPLIFNHAAERDPVALKLLEAAVADLEEVLDKILSAKDTPFCLSGGLGPAYQPWLGQRFRSRLREPIADAVTGATRLAIKQFGDRKTMTANKRAT